MIELASSVVFQGKRDDIYVEVGQPNNVTGITPEIFDNAFDGYAKLALLDVYGSIYPVDKMSKPYFYFRHIDVINNFYRFGNIVVPGDGCMKTQEGVLHPEEMADKDTPVNGYRKISENPLIYGFDSTEKKVIYRYKNDGLYIEEGDFFQMKAEPWPIAIYDHQSAYANSSCIFQPSTFSGILDGKHFVGLGSFDRFHISKDRGSFNDVPLGYISFVLSGIRRDGKKESLFISSSLEDDGKTLLVYFLQGEQPIITNKFVLEADWYRLPYVNDGTCIFKEAIIRFFDKEIHYIGKWGTKGYLKEPRLDKHGQSQSFGIWYEGKEANYHRLSSGFYEGMEVYDHKLIQMGFNVIE